MKSKCDKNKHYTYIDTSDYYISMPIKDTLEESIRCYLKKRELDFNCPLCGSGEVTGTRSPKVQSFGFYVILILKRFENDGERDERKCTYPMDINMNKYLEQ